MKRPKCIGQKTINKFRIGLKYLSIPTKSSLTTLEMSLFEGL